MWGFSFYECGKRLFFILNFLFLEFKINFLKVSDFLLLGLLSFGMDDVGLIKIILVILIDMYNVDWY